MGRYASFSPPPRFLVQVYHQEQWQASHWAASSGLLFLLQSSCGSSSPDAAVSGLQTPQPSFVRISSRVISTQPSLACSSLNGTAKQVGRPGRVSRVLPAAAAARQMGKWGDLDVCHEFSLQQLMQATDNWADANRLGRGGFATVYLGVSAQGEMWAVKRCRVMTNDFEKEVRAMATLRHENLVRLLGFCVDMQVESGRQEQVLVYEYVGNGDLKHHIHHAKCPLTFHQRLRIALGAAEGLSYLHSFSTPIVHRDVKPANILVTDSLAAKLADFGLLKQLTEGDGEGGATRIAGTPGYVDPDYNRTRVVSPKTDVYRWSTQKDFGLLKQLTEGDGEGGATRIAGTPGYVHPDYNRTRVVSPKTDVYSRFRDDLGLLKQLSEGDGDGEGSATRIAGTPGYVDRDYNRTQVVSPKTDVYSFGVVLLEMLTGRPAVMSEEDYHIATWVSALSVSLPLLHTGAVIPRLSMPSHLALKCRALPGASPPHHQAAQRVADYELDLLKDPSMEVPEDAIVDFADIALDCLKMPWTCSIPSPHQAAQRVADYELDLLKDPSMEVPENTMVEFADIALDCLKMPWTCSIPSPHQAAQRVADYELDLLKDPSMEVPEDAIVEFADIALDCLKMPWTCSIPSPHQAAQRVADYELDLLKDPSMEVPEDAIVEFADIALDCLKMPCTRRPDMKAVAHRIGDLIQKYCTGKGEREAAPVEPVTRALVSEDVDSVGMEGFGGVSGFTSTESTDKSGAVSGQESGSLLGKQVEGRDSEEVVGLRISATDSMTSRASHAEHSAIENRVHPR
ncbi:unnamed protein product [Closterium sp. Naga37s-1]|nr:unnamed protein product [Closterium sp. Naga37s-1]